MKKNAFLIFIVAILFVNPLFAQNNQKVEDLLPMKDIDQSISKIYSQVSNLGFQNHVDINADLKTYDDCIWNNQQGRMKIQIDWYNTNDETGKMIADMIKGDIPDLMKSFLYSSFSDQMKIDQAKEEIIKGGKLLVYSKNTQCVNEIAGPNGETQYFTAIRAFVFTGSLKMEISLYSYTKADALKQTLNEIIKKAESFDFSSLKN
jgi:hypothetical protein